MNHTYMLKLQPKDNKFANRENKVATWGYKVASRDDKVANWEIKWPAGIIK